MSATLKDHPELFFFGICLDKFQPQKAARILGVVWHKREPCLKLRYPDGEVAHAALTIPSRGLWEILPYEAGAVKYGEHAFEI
jgi:hypothetical protein